MPDRSPFNRIMAITAKAQETVEAARATQFEGHKLIAKSDQAIKESHEAVERADKSLRRLSY